MPLFTPFSRQLSMLFSSSLALCTCITAPSSVAAAGLLDHQFNPLIPSKPVARKRAPTAAACAPRTGRRLLPLKH